MGAGVMAPKPGSTFQPTPPQGGKGGGRPMPPQGGKGGVQQPVQQPVQPQSPYTPIGAQGGKGNMPLPPGVQMPIGLPPSQVPAQGGKAPLTQEQIAALAPNIDPIRPMPQVSPPQGIRFPSDFTPPAPGQTYINPNINPAGFTGTLPPRLQQPAPVMPRPVPQVMPRQPTPKPAPQGLAQIQQMLAGQQLAPGRPAPAPGLNGVPGNQNPRYFGPGRK